MKKVVENGRGFVNMIGVEHRKIFNLDESSLRKVEGFVFIVHRIL